jgi:hypothetical protein
VVLLPTCFFSLFYLPADAGVGDVDIDLICKALGRGLYWN